MVLAGTYLRLFFIFFAPTLAFGDNSSKEADSSSIILHFMEIELRRANIEKSVKDTILRRSRSVLETPEVHDAISKTSPQRKKEFRTRLLQIIASHPTQAIFQTSTSQKHLCEAIIATIKSVFLTPLAPSPSAQAISQVKKLRELVFELLIQEFPGIDSLNEWPEICHSFDDAIVTTQHSDFTILYKEPLPKDRFDELLTAIRKNSDAVHEGNLSRTWSTLNKTQRHDWLKRGHVDMRRMQLEELIGNAFMENLSPEYLSMQVKLTSQFTRELTRLESQLYEEQLAIAKRQREESVHQVEKEFSQTLQQQIRSANPAPLLPHGEVSTQATNDNDYIFWIVISNCLLGLTIAGLAIARNRSRSRRHSS